METVRDILAAHQSGISRGGLLAWARLRGDPQMTDAQLDAALAELGDQVVDVQGFLYLRANAPASAVPPAPARPAAAGSWMPPAPARPDGVTATPGEGPGWMAYGGRWVPASGGSSQRTRVIAVVAVLVAAGVGAFLVRGANPGAPQPTPTMAAMIESRDVRVGDCIVVPTREFDVVMRLPCTDPHDGEVFFVGNHPGGDYPSDEAFDAWFEAECLPAFGAYTGTAFDDQEVLDVGWFVPTYRAWQLGSRDVTCYLSPFDGTTTTVSHRGANP